MQESPDSSTPQPSPAAAARKDDLHNRIGQLTRQLHNALNELGYAAQLRSTMDKLPDAQSRLTYITRLTGEAAEKVLNRVDQAKTQNDYIASETHRTLSSLVADPVAAVAKGEVYNFLTDVKRVTQEADTHLTEIMMAQDFHDLTGQVIARVVTLAATIEKQLVELLIQTAPANSPVSVLPEQVEQEQREQEQAQQAAGERGPLLHGPVVDPDNTPDVVTDQSQVDDLLASLGF
jgi:chemotaxis protein CheZ